jgi:iron(III) transport system permease protein
MSGTSRPDASLGGAPLLLRIAQRIDLNWILRLGGIGLGIAMSLILIIPVGVLIATSVWSSQFGTPGHLVLSNYSFMLTDPNMVPFLTNTVVFTVGASLIAVLVGMFLAWAITSADIPGRRWLRILPLIIFAVPALAQNPAWIELYSPRTGLINLGLMHLLSLQNPPFDIFSWPGFLVMAGLNASPVAYIVFLAPFESIDPSFEEASRVSGARFVYRFVHITLPVLAPAVISALALTMIIMASSFEVPVIVGIPASIVTYMSLIYEQVTVFGNYNLAAAQSMLYLVFLALLLGMYLVATKRERLFVTVSGRRSGSSSTSTSTSTLVRVIATSGVIAYALIVLVLPVGINIAISLVPVYTVTAGNPFAHISFDNYRTIMSSVDLVGPVANTLKLAFVVTFCTLLSASVLSMLALKSRLPGRRVFEVIGAAPIAVPAMVFSVMLLITFLAVPFLTIFYNSPVPLVVAETVVFMPFTMRILATSLIQLHNELMEASHLSGANILTTIRSIVAPLWGPALLYAGSVVFILSYGQLGAAVLLVTPNFPVISTTIFGYWQHGEVTEVAALNMIALLVPIIVVGVAWLAFSFRLPRVGARERYVAQVPDVIGGRSS